MTPAGECTFVDCEPHTPLGVLSTPLYNPTIVTIPERSMLLLYTDGLVEERHEDLADGLARLAAAVDATEPDIEVLCDSVLKRMVPDEKNDDIALLAARLKT